MIFPEYVERGVRIAAAAASLSLLAMGVVQCGPAGPAGTFTDEAVITGLEAPIAMLFAKDGGLFVAEKKGLIWYYRSLDDAQPVLVTELSLRVMSFWDRGLMSMELHPEFPETPYLYALYAFDAPIGGTPPVYNDEDNRPHGAVSAKLTRFTLERNASSGYTVSAEKDLVHDWCQVFPSHSVGAVRFGPDGALYVSGGDGSSFAEVDVGQLESLCGDPVGEGGSLRSQDMETPGDPTTLDGAIIRIDPETGGALGDNPFAESHDENARRIIAWGLRNPFRFTFRPGTREIWVGDVGWNTWEEINRIEDPLEPNNFGWPCYEGAARSPDYEFADMCQDLYRKVERDRRAHTPPVHTHRHGGGSSDPGPCGGGGAAVSGLAFYDKAGYPDHFKGALFFSDYAAGCIGVLPRGPGGLPDARRAEVFYTGAKGPVDLRTGPDGSLYYAAIQKGEIRRIRYGTTRGPGGEETPDPRAPRPVITAPPADLIAFPGSVVPYAGSATDADGRPLPEAALAWSVEVHHCNDGDPEDCHVHVVVDSTGESAGEFTMPGDHEGPSYVLVRLRAAVVEGGIRHAADATRKVLYPAGRGGL
jgi:glucose/arabinose dehydrogenase